MDARTRPGAEHERSRFAVVGERLPKSLRLAIDQVADSGELRDLQLLALKLLAECEAFQHRQFRRKESQAMRRLDVAR